MDRDTAALTVMVQSPPISIGPVTMEIGIVGASAAIANAICHATGKRMRDLSITHDKLLD